MKVFLLLFIFSVFLAGWNIISTNAQIKTPTGGASSDANRAKTKSIPKNPAISTVDFKNFTFPDPSGGKIEKTFTLKNGSAGKKGVSTTFTLRKTYYFDITGDDNDEAISHIMVDGCQVGCESSQLFYVHTLEKNKPKLLWKIAVAGDTMGGLKAVNFKVNEIVLEAFGECFLNGWLINADIDLKKNPNLKTSNYTRFVFSGGETGFTSADREILPLLRRIDFATYRPTIVFGNKP